MCGGGGRVDWICAVLHYRGAKFLCVALLALSAWARCVTASCHGDEGASNKHGSWHALGAPARDGPSQKDSHNTNSHNIAVNGSATIHFSCCVFKQVFRVE